MTLAPFILRGKALYRDMVGIMNEAARNNGECRIAVPDGALLSKFPLKGMRKMISFLPIYGI